MHWNLIVESIFSFTDFIPFYLNTAITLYEIVTYRYAASIAAKFCMAKPLIP